MLVGARPGHGVREHVERVAHLQSRYEHKRHGTALLEGLTSLPALMPAVQALLDKLNVPRITACRGGLAQALQEETGSSVVCAVTRRVQAQLVCGDGFNSCVYVCKNGVGSTRVCAGKGQAQVRVRLLSDVLGQPHFPLPRGLSVRGQAMLGDGPLNTIGQAPPPHSLVVWAESVWFPRGGWVNNQNSRLRLDRDEMGIICFVWVCGWMDGWVCGCAGA